MVSKERALRIADRIVQELSEILVTQSEDPRLAGITVTAVEVDRELDYAKIYVSAIEGSERSQEVLAGLNHAHGFLRSELARRIQLRSFPRLRFNWDPTFERAEHMERLFAAMQAEEKARSQAGSPVEEDQPEEDLPSAGETSERPEDGE